MLESVVVHESFVHHQVSQEFSDLFTLRSVELTRTLRMRISSIRPPIRKNKFLVLNSMSKVEQQSAP